MVMANYKIPREKHVDWVGQMCDLLYTKGGKIPDHRAMVYDWNSLSLQRHRDSSSHPGTGKLHPMPLIVPSPLCPTKTPQFGGNGVDVSHFQAREIWRRRTHFPVWFHLLSNTSQSQQVSPPSLDMPCHVNANRTEFWVIWTLGKRHKGSLEKDSWVGSRQCLVTPREMCPSEGTSSSMRGSEIALVGGQLGTFSQVGGKFLSILVLRGSSQLALYLLVVFRDHAVPRMESGLALRDLFWYKSLWQYRISQSSSSNAPVPQLAAWERKHLLFQLPL